MKKIMVFFVVLSMLCSMVCMPALAEDVADGVIRYDFEEYGSGGVSYYVKTSETHGNYLRVDVGEAGIETKNPTFEFVATINQTGYYDISYLAGRNLDGWTSTLSIAIDGVEIGKNDNASIKTVAGYGYEAYMPMTHYTKKEVWLEKGDRTVTVTVNKCKSQTAFDKYSFQLDYIEFAPAKGVEISPSVPTVIGFEEYGTGGNTSYIKNSSVHGAYLRVDAGSADTPLSNPSFKFALDIAESGYYDITYLAGRNLDGWTSTLSIDIDGVEIGKNDNASTETISGYDYEAYMPMTKYTKKEVWLEKGNRIVTVTVNKCKSQTAFDKYSFQLDYIEIAPKRVALISPDESTVIDFEEYGTGGDSKNILYSEAHGNYLRVDVGEAGVEIKNPSFEFEVEVEESGYYDITYIAGRNLDGWTSTLSILIDGVEIGKNDASSTQGVEGYEKVYEQFMPMTKYTKKGIWLEKGEKTVSVSVNKCSSQTAFDKYSFQLDYIEFVKSEEAFVISPEQSTTIEFEEYASVGVASNGTNTGSGTGYVRLTEKDINPSFTVLVNVEKAGYYNIDYVTGYKDSSGISLVTFKMGEEIIGTNNDASRSVVSSFTDTWNNFMPMSKFYKKRVWLTEGETVLTVNVEPRTTDGKYTFQADCITFAPCSDELTVSGENVEAFTCYEEAVSGTPVLALYNGNELVCVSIGDVVDGENYVTTSAVTTETFNKAKVFIWNNMTDIIPVIGGKTLNVD